MNFRPRRRDEPEINLIPFIDVLLVVLIFLMLSTTYSKFTELQLTLPVADVEQQRDRPREIIVAIAADGRYAINKTAVEDRSVTGLTQALAAAAVAGKDSVVIISADATAPHQSVVSVMEASRRAGLSQITFATQTRPAPGAEGKAAMPRTGPAPAARFARPGARPGLPCPCCTAPCWACIGCHMHWASGVGPGRHSGHRRRQRDCGRRWKDPRHARPGPPSARWRLESRHRLARLWPQHGRLPRGPS